MAGIMTPFYRNNLTKLPAWYGTDKTNEHWYTPHYVHHFQRYKKKIRLLEIGGGGVIKDQQ